jgi:hypothetical protein
VLLSTANLHKVSPKERGKSTGLLRQARTFEPGRTNLFLGEGVKEQNDGENEDAEVEEE